MRKTFKIVKPFVNGLDERLTERLGAVSNQKGDVKHLQELEIIGKTDFENEEIINPTKLQIEENSRTKIEMGTESNGKVSHRSQNEEFETEAGKGISQIKYSRSVLNPQRSEQVE